jgi:Na+/proline symporter
LLPNSRELAPLPLGLSLIINGVTLAHHINNELVLTLPDIYGKRYGIATEICASICTCVSFTCLLAGRRAVALTPGQGVRLV